MNTIINATGSFTKASTELENLNGQPSGRPWYTSVEDYCTKESTTLRIAHEEQESLRQNLLAVMASSADSLVTIERSIGTGRVMRLAAVSNIDPKVVVTMLNY